MSEDDRWWNELGKGSAKAGQCFACLLTLLGGRRECDANGELKEKMRGDAMFLSGIAFALQLKDEAIRSSLCEGHTARLILLFSTMIDGVPSEFLREGRSWWNARR